MKKLNIDFHKVIDLHVHVGRIVDGEILDGQIKRAFTPEILMKEELKAIVVKEHFNIPKVPPDQNKVFSSITLNNHILFKPKAIRAAILNAKDIKIVFFPTFHCKAHIYASRNDAGYKKMLVGFREAKKPVFLLSNAKLRPIVKDIVDVILEEELIVATGHVSWQEAYALAEYILSKNKKVIVTHPYQRFIAMPVKAQKELASGGAWIERCAVTYLMGKEGAYSIDTLVRQILDTGVSQNFISSDSGQFDNPGPKERLESYAQLLFKNGLSEEYLNVMLLKNPIKILF